MAGWCALPRRFRNSGWNIVQHECAYLPAWIGGISGVGGRHGSKDTFRQR